MKFLEKYIENKILREAIEWIITIVAAVLLFLVIQQFFIKAANVSGNSMEPTFYHGERVLIDRFSYLFSEPKYDDVVAFPFKEDPKQKLIKRIIGRPGDVIDFVDLQFTVNGEALSNNYGTEYISASGSVDYPLTVPEGSYFVLGDNRNSSKDSRYAEVGCIPKKDIIGRIMVRIWPLSKLGAVK